MIRSCSVPGTTAGGQARATERLAFPKTPEQFKEWTFLESCLSSRPRPVPSSYFRSLRLLSTPNLPVAMYPTRVLRMQPSRASYTPAPVSDPSSLPRSDGHTISGRLMLTPVCRRRATAVRQPHESTTLRETMDSGQPLGMILEGELTGLI